MILPGFPNVIAAKAGFDPSTPIGTFVPSQGGYFIGVIIYADTRKFALFLPENATGSTTGLRWKTTGTGTAGTQSLDDGVANVDAMAVAGLSLHPAGEWCRGLTTQGFTDWYLPALNELLLAIGNNSSLPSGERYEDTLYYLSSTENSANVAQAFRVRPLDNSQLSSNKNAASGFPVRAIRRLAV